MSWRPELLGAFALLARACGRLVQRGRPRPVVVGGAAVEYYTASGTQTGDVDLVGHLDEEFVRALLEVGFRTEDRPGHLLRGFYHPTLPIGVEIVSGDLFDGRADRRRLGAIDLDGETLLLAPIEDLIADRLAQHEASGRRDAEMLVQARLLLAMAEVIDLDYLRRRIAEEGGAPELLDI